MVTGTKFRDDQSRGFWHLPPDRWIELIALGYTDSPTLPARMLPSVQGSNCCEHLFNEFRAFTEFDGHSVSELLGHVKDGRESFQGAAGFVPDRKTLPMLRKAVPSCNGCDLFRLGASREVLKEIP
jgi:hypothetical protein